MRRFALALALLAGTGCASMQQSLAESDARSKRTQIDVRMRGKPDVVTARVVQAFMDNQLAVNSAQGGIVEAKLPREQGLMGSYEIVTRAVVPPADSGSTVTLYGEETQVGTDDDAAHTTRLNPSNMGAPSRPGRSS